MSQWLQQLANHPDQPLTVRQSKDLEKALQGTLKIAQKYRRLSRLVEFLDMILYVKYILNRAKIARLNCRFIDAL